MLFLEYSCTDKHLLRLIGLRKYGCVRKQRAREDIHHSGNLSIGEPSLLSRNPAAQGRRGSVLRRMVVLGVWFCSCLAGACKTMSFAAIQRVGKNS